MNGGLIDSREVFLGVLLAGEEFQYIWFRDSEEEEEEITIDNLPIYLTTAY